MQQQYKQYMEANRSIRQSWYIMHPCSDPPDPQYPKELPDVCEAITQAWIERETPNLKALKKGVWPVPKKRILLTDSIPNPTLDSKQQ